MAKRDSLPKENQLPPPAYSSIYPGMPEDKTDVKKYLNDEYEKKKHLDDANQAALIIRAADLAARRHRKQRRKDLLQTPYINHPIGVAYLLMEKGHITDTATIVAGILHDIVEDTKTTIDELKEMFGEEVASIVQECTFDKSIGRHTRMKQSLDRAPTLSDKAKVIEMADKLYNMRDLEKGTPLGWTSQQKKDYFVYVKELASKLKGVNCHLETELDQMINKNIK